MRRNLLKLKARDLLRLIARSSKLQNLNGNPTPLKRRKNQVSILLIMSNQFPKRKNFKLRISLVFHSTHYQ